MPEKMNLKLRVRNYHIDSYGHVNNAQYLILLEEARTVFLERLGFSLSHFRRQGIYIFITESRLKYKNPATLDDELVIYGWFNELATRRASWQHIIENKTTGKTVLTGAISGVFYRDGKVIAIPPQVREGLMPLYISAD